MNIIVFCGPTITRDEVAAELEADVRPPAARGDVLMATLGKPKAIGLIDGYFDRVPAVWHKEILWAMHEGIHVFGAASMGALRSAELASFGMEGVGAVYESYCSGELVDDDEVAVVHASAEQGFRKLSEAMVNVRATLRAAHAARVISEETRIALERIAKALSYPDRSYPMILARAVEETISQPNMAALRDWLPQGRVDLKHEDAIRMLQRIAEHQRLGWSRKRVDYVFARTDAWESLERTITARGLPSSDPLVATSSVRDIVEELVLDGQGDTTGDAAVARAACLEHARRLEVTMEGQALDAFVEEFRRERNLFHASEFEQWLAEQRLQDGEEAAAFFEREATFQMVKKRHALDRVASLVDQLRVLGEFGRLAERACAKRGLLSSRGLDRPELRDTGLSEEELWRWYFGERLGREVPTHLASHARRQGGSIEQLRSAAVREFVYLRLLASQDKAAPE
jgi:hypothetical protein